MRKLPESAPRPPVAVARNLGTFPSCGCTRGSTGSVQAGSVGGRRSLGRPSSPGNRHVEPVQRLARGDEQDRAVGAAEGAVGRSVGEGDRPQPRAVRGEDHDGGRGTVVPGDVGVAGPVDRQAVRLVHGGEGRLGRGRAVRRYREGLQGVVERQPAAGGVLFAVCRRPCRGPSRVGEPDRWCADLHPRGGRRSSAPPDQREDRRRAVVRPCAAMLASPCCRGL